MPSDFWKTSFRLEQLQKITKTRGADKFKKISKNGCRKTPNPWKLDPGAHEKTMLKNIRQQKHNMFKKGLRNRFQKTSLGVAAPPGAPLVAQSAFGHQKWSPSSPKVLPRIETKNDIKETPDLSGTGLADCAKRLQLAAINRLINAVNGRNRNIH